MKLSLFHALEFASFSGNRRSPLHHLQLLSSPTLARVTISVQVFESTLEQVRRWYGIAINGYVVMPEHVHLLLHEPERKSLSVAIQMLKQISGRKIGTATKSKFWQRRYYDRNIRTAKEFDATLHYIHCNPVRRALCARPEHWSWSSFLHHATGVDGTVEIESQWTARKREKMGLVPIQKVRSSQSFR